MSTPSQSLPRPDDIAMIVCDVDGTLLTRTHIVHPRTVSAFAQLRKLRPELPIVVASGKQYSSCADVRAALDLPDNFPAIHAHGALIHGDGGVLLEAKRIDASALLEVIEKMRGKGTFVFRPKEVIMINDEAGKDWCSIARRYDFFVEDFSGSERSAFLGRIQAGEEDIVKLTVCTEEGETEAVIAELERIQRSLSSSLSEPIFNITRAIPWIIEIVPPGVNKKGAVQALCAQRGIEMRNVAAFGDGDNDAAMLEAVGVGVAMGNAMPEPKRRASYLTTTNDEGGVGAFLGKVYGFDVEP